MTSVVRARVAVLFVVMIVVIIVLVVVKVVTVMRLVVAGTGDLAVVPVVVVTGVVSMQRTYLVLVATGGKRASLVARL